jgi:hypothetical protein
MHLLLVKLCLLLAQNLSFRQLLLLLLEAGEVAAAPEPPPPAAGSAGVAALELLPFLLLIQKPRQALQLDF